MSVDIRGDSLPLDLLPAFTDVIAQVRGHAVGTLAMRGTLKRPSLVGALSWTNGSLKIVPTGVIVNNITGAVRMARDTIYVDSLAGQSGGGPVRLTGRMYVGNWREPAFDLYVVANEAQILNNGKGHVDAAWASASRDHSFRVRHGHVEREEWRSYIPESSKKSLVTPAIPRCSRSSWTPP